MTKREIIGSIAIAVVVGLLGVFGGKMLGTYERGETASIEDAVGSVLDEKLKVEIGGETKSMSEAMSLMNERQVRMEEALKRLTE